MALEQEIINVEMIAESPTDEDIPGIKLLMHQLLKYSGVDVRALSNLIAAQSYIGSTLKVTLIVASLLQSELPSCGS